MQRLFLKTARLPEGWARDVLVTMDATGRIAGVEADAVPPGDALRLDGHAVPGMPNLHGHAH